MLMKVYNFESNGVVIISEGLITVFLILVYFEF